MLYDCRHDAPAAARMSRSSSADCRSSGVATLLLTSRGPEFRGPPSASFDAMRLRLPSIGAAGARHLQRRVPCPTIRPIRKRTGSRRRKLSKVQAEPRAEPVSYEQRHLFMTAGQHKGMMLLTLLQDIGPDDIKAMVYVDDNVRHVGSVFSAVAGRGHRSHRVPLQARRAEHEEVRVRRQVEGRRQSGRRDAAKRQADRWKQVERAQARRRASEAGRQFVRRA